MRLWPFSRLRSSTVYRIFEIIPGFLVWLTLIVAVVVSFLKPLWAVYFIIIFDLYWLLRVMYLLIYLVTSWRKYQATIAVDWWARVQTLPNWQRIYHLVFLPTYGESIDILRASVGSLAQVHYPLDKFIVVLAGEARDREHFLKNAEIIKQEFGHAFGHFLVTLHPDDIVGEIAGKGSNNCWAGHRAQELIDTLEIPYEDIVVSTFDVDSCAHPDYFAYLTHTYLTVPDPLHSSYQPVALYSNNVWDSPAINRVVANSTTFWLLTDLARPERLFTFSSHSMPFKALTDVGFWQNDIVTEDSRIFLQCFVRYNGNYRVTPLFISIAMDTVYAGSFWRSLVNQYKQQRRWAYGVENFAYMAWHFWRSKEIPFLKKFRYIWNQLEGVYSWATAPVIILILGWLPLQFASNEVTNTLLAYNAPSTLSWLMRLAMVGLVFSAIFSTILLPKRPMGRTRLSYVMMVLQWFLFPPCMIIFGSIPAIDAQTRLMLGKYLGFWVTQKNRA